ncbi:MAG TPA: hypothetical protein VK590_01430, partial [Saprospiraceae bacterium]|nr:hypothetical protein [Saprospiraceae bacterium]
MVRYQLIAGSIFLLLCSCKPVYYIPTTQNIPLIHQKGQINLAVAANNKQVDLNAAYGIIEGLAIQINENIIFSHEGTKGNGSSGSLLEAGLGFFYNISPSLLFDTYALAGWGDMENHFSNYYFEHTTINGNLAAKFYRLSLQPGISYHKNFKSISGSVRFSNLEYYNIAGDLLYNTEDQWTYLNKNKSNILLEPALTFRNGSENIKFQFQAMLSLNLTNWDFYQHNTFLSWGIYFNLN